MVDSSKWHKVSIKPTFFTQIRRFMSSAANQYQPSDHSVTEANVDGGERTEREDAVDDDDDDAVLQRAVKRLHFGRWEDKEAAAGDIKRLAGEDLRRRKLLAEVGVIPPLVAMVASHKAAPRRLALQALLELAHGTGTNKALTVEAGILSKLSEYIDVREESAKYEIAQLIMSLSSLVNAQYSIDSSKVLPVVLHILDSNSKIDTKMLCLGTLYNLSTMLDNVGILATNEVVNTLVRLSLVKEASEKALATLGNLVVSIMGKKALENNAMVPASLIEILTWDDKSKSQELSVYILMILAHQSSLQREKMAKAGIVPVLLEVALLGSPLAQKRAFKLLQWFKDERQMRMGPIQAHKREGCQLVRL